MRNRSGRYADENIFLYHVWKKGFSPEELQLLVMIAKKLNKKGEAVIPKEDIESIYKRELTIDDLNVICSKLLSFVNVDYEDSLLSVTLFDFAEYRKNDAGGRELYFTCTEYLIKAFFKNNEIGNYQCDDFISLFSLSSIHAYTMFLFLEQHKNKTTFTVGLNELKKQLWCDDRPSYDVYANFDNNVLKKALTEIHEKTKLQYSYKPVKLGTSVVAVQFTFGNSKEYEGEVFFVEDSPVLTNDEWSAKFYKKGALCKLLYHNRLSLEEMKLIDIYCANINPTDRDTREIVVSKPTLIKLLEVKSNIKNEELKKRLKTLSSPVRLNDGTESILFDKADLRQNERYGVNEIVLRCNDEVEHLFFSVEEDKGIIYELKEVTSLASRYSYMMFLFLENNRFRGTFSIDVLTLKHILGCEKEKTYDSYKRLNDLLLKKVQAELHTKTDIRYEYRPIKSGREIVQIEFSVMENKRIELLQTQDPPQEQEIIDLGLNDWNFGEAEDVVDIECEHKEQEVPQKHKEKEVSFFRDNGEPKPMSEFLRELKEAEDENKKNPKKTPSEIAEEKIRQIYADDSLDQDTKIERVKAVIKAKFTGELK